MAGNTCYVRRGRIGAWCAINNYRMRAYVYTDEEVELALSKLKTAGPDGLMAEHLQEPGWRSECG